MDHVGVQSKHRTRQCVTKLWVTDIKGNLPLATCFCDNGSEVNLQSTSFLPDDCVFDSIWPVTLEGVSGQALPGGKQGSSIRTHLLAQDLWTDRVAEDLVLSDYSYRADIKYDLYLGQPWLTKNRVAPVGHRRCFPLETGPEERPVFKFLHSGFESAEDTLKKIVPPRFGEDVALAEINGCIEGESLSRETQAKPPGRWRSSNYRVVGKWGDFLCEYFSRNHSFTPFIDAFANHRNRRFRRLFEDAWAQKWDKTLWITPPSMLFSRWSIR